MLLIAFKYLGLFIAAGSSVWGTIHTLTVPGPNGEKRLTKQGVIAIVLTLAGLTVSVVSEDLKRRQEAEAQSAKVRAEADRTNRIILGSQPLMRLFWTLNLESADPKFRDMLIQADKDIMANAESSQGGVPAVPFETQEYVSRVLPLLRYMAGIEPPADDSAETEPKEDDDGAGDEDNTKDAIVALIPLDESQNTVLSFGEIDPKANWRRAEDPKQLISGGFAPLDGDARPANSWPLVSSPRPKEGLAKCSLQWNLDPNTLENSVDRANQAVRSTATLPETLRLALLSNLEDVPFAQNNFAQSHASNLWRPTDSEIEIETRKDISRATLTVEVNGYRNFLYQYNLKRIYRMELFDRESGDEVDAHCIVWEFELVGRGLGTER